MVTKQCFPQFLDKMGKTGAFYDWSADVKKLTMPVMLVLADNDSVSQKHIAEFFALLGGGVEEPGWQNTQLSKARLAERAGLDPAAFDLKTFRSTYATRMLRQGFDVRTVQDWMGHKSLETTMRYLVPATDVHDRLDEIEIPGVTESAVPKKAPGSERQLVFPRKKMRR